MYWCFKKAAEELGVANPMYKTGGCLDHWEHAVANGARCISSSFAAESPDAVKPGMIFVIDHGHGLGHTGLVESVKGSVLTTIEGNTNSTKTREGGGVYRLTTRKISEITMGFIDYSGRVSVAVQPTREARGVEATPVALAAEAAPAPVAQPAEVIGAAPPGQAPLQPPQATLQLQPRAVETAAPCYRLGSTGEEVRKLQNRLKEVGVFTGQSDGVFGGATLAAVKLFQSGQGLASDGVAGPATWRALFNEDLTTLPIATKSLQERCLALTGSFETDASFPDCFSAMSGDFDGQGISYGVLQWNLGRQTLQPLLEDLLRDHCQVAADIFGPKLSVLKELHKADHEDIMNFARSIQNPLKHTVNEPWRGMLKALGRTEECQQIQVRYAKGLFNAAVAHCQEYGIWSERAVALMFDILVQNGGIKELVKQRIHSKFHELPETSPEELEAAKLNVIANVRAEAAKPEWVNDVRSRKLCCANGKGNVHGVPYNLQDQYGIGLVRYGG